MTIYIYIKQPKTDKVDVLSVAFFCFLTGLNDKMLSLKDAQKASSFQSDAQVFNTPDGKNFSLPFLFEKPRKTDLGFLFVEHFDVEK